MEEIDRATVSYHAYIHKTGSDVQKFKQVVRTYVAIDQRKATATLYFYPSAGG